MAVYKYRAFESLESSLDDLATFFFQRMPLHLTPDEVITGFINPEHVDQLRAMEEMVGFVGSTHLNPVLYSSNGDALRTLVGFAGRPPVILPRYAQQLQPDCPGTLREKIGTWVQQRIELGNAFGDALDALRELNDRCVDARAMAIVLPCLPTIMASVNSDPEASTNKRAQKLAHNKTFGILPKLPPQVKKRLLEVSAVVNSVSLMREAPLPSLPKGYATVNYYNGGSHPSPRRPNIFDAARGVPGQLVSTRDAKFF